MNEASPNPLSGTGTPPPHLVPPPLNVDGRWTIGVYPTPEAEPEVVYSDALKEAAESFMRRVFTQYPAELTLSESRIGLPYHAIPAAMRILGGLPWESEE